MFARSLILSACLSVFDVGLAQTQLSISNRIRVELVGLRNDDGQVLCALHSSATWLAKGNDKVVAQAKAGIAHGYAFCEFPDIAPGKYAVSVFHDENSNGKLDKNILGIPREGVGVSNNVTGHFGPPRFDEVAFSFSAGTIDLKILIRYL